MEGKIIVITITNPFTKEYIIEEISSGVSVRELSYRNGIDYIVALNGKIIEEIDYDYIIDYDACVVLTPKLGNDDIGRALAFVGLAAAALLTGFGVAGLISGAGFLAGIKAGLAGTLSLGFWGSLAATATLAVGGLILNALFPISTSNVDAFTGETTSQYYSWNPHTLQQQGVCIPRIYGTTKSLGNIINCVIDNTTDKESNSLLNLVIGLCQGPIAGISDIKINKRSWDSIQGVTVETRKGTSWQTPIQNIANQVTEEIVNIELPYNQTITYTITNIDFYEFDVELACMGGLFRINDYGSASPLSLDIEGYYEIKKLGQVIHTATFKDLKKLVDYNVVVSQWYIGFYNYDYGYVVVTQATGDTNPDSHYHGEFAGYDANGIPLMYIYAQTGSYTKTVEENYGTITGKSSFPVFKTLIENIYTGISADTPEDYSITIYLKNRTNIPEDTRTKSKLHFHKIRKHYIKQTYPGLALCAIKALSSDDISNNLDFECIVKGSIVSVYSSPNTYTLTWSDNPAWVCLDILTQPIIRTKVDSTYEIVGYNGLSPDRIEINDFILWANYCDELVTPSATGIPEKRMVFNGTFDSEMSVWEAAFKVCEVGHACLYWKGSKLRVVVDKPRLPVQLFSVGNIGIDSFRENFLPLTDRASEIEVEFINERKNYERDRIVVFDESIDSKNKVSVFPIGITRPTQAWRFANRLLKNNRYITKSVELDVDVDAIACQLGDVIYVQNDVVPSFGFGGRISSATTTTVVLDRLVSFTDGQIVIRMQNGNLVTKSLQSPASNVYTVTTTTPFSEIPSPFDVYIVGEKNKARKFVVTSIRKANDLKCTITAVEYFDELFNEDDSNFSLPDITTIFNPLVQIGNVTLTDGGFLDQSNNIVRFINVEFDILNQAVFREANIFLSRAGEEEFSFVGKTSNKRFYIPNVEPVTTYTVAVQGINHLGMKSETLATQTIQTRLYPNFVSGSITVGPDMGLVNDLIVALNKVAEHGGGVVVLKKGEYVLSSTIQVPDVDIIIAGEDINNTVLKKTSFSSGDFFQINKTNSKKFSLKNLTIINGYNNTNIIKTDGEIDLVIEDVNINSSVDCKFINIQENNKKINVTFSNVSIYENGSGQFIVYGNRNSGGNIVIQNCNFENSSTSRSGMWLGRCVDDVKLINNKFKNWTLVVNQWIYYQDYIDVYGGVEMSKNIVSFEKPDGYSYIVFLSGKDIFMIDNQVASTIYNSTSFAIVSVVSPSANTTIVNVLVKNNSIETIGTATNTFRVLDLYGLEKGSVSNNFLKGFSTSYGTGIYTRSSLDFIIKENEFYNLSTGIYTDYACSNLIGFGNKYSNVTTHRNINGNNNIIDVVRGRDI